MLPALSPLLLALGALGALGTPAVQAASPVTGPWRASIDCPGGPIAFGLELAREGEAWRAELVNGPERRAVERVSVAGTGLVAWLDPYDSRLEARVAAGGRDLEGEWIRYAGAAGETRLGFRATAGAAPPPPDLDPAIRERLAGRWRARFSASEGHAVGVFELPGPTAELHGTFLTTLGDYRYLAGEAGERGLVLSVFDGAHAFLFRAELSPDGSLAGDFWSRDTWHETWTAVKDADVELPDPFGLTRWTGTVPLAELSFPDLAGVRRSLDDESFRGPARLIVLFGSWCPNCNDLTRYLLELQRRYGPRGLSILGLAFELGEDPERHARVLGRYAAHHGVQYPILVAGPSDKARASAAFPLLDRVRAYPTTIFLDGSGAVEAVHTGFSGPATGAAHDHLRERFEALIEGLLDGGHGGSRAP